MCPKCEDTLQNIFNAMCEGYAIHEIICDDRGRPINYRFLEVNYAFEQMTGLNREEILGKTVKDIFPNIDSFYIDTYGKVAMTGEPASFENYAEMLGKHFKVSVFTPQKGKFITLFTDITRIKRSEEIMKKHKLLFDCAQDAVLYVRDDGMIMDANESAYRLYGYTYDELLSLSIHNIRHTSTKQLFEQQMKQADEAGVVFESIHVRKDGSNLPVEVSAKGTIIGNEKVRIHIIRDITERKNTEERIVYLANHDSLTGIPNRAFLMQELDNALELANRGEYKLAVMLFDIDKFKMINDVHGHQAGDIVLKAVAARTKGAIRNIDNIGRLGGDEFVIIQPMVKNNNDVCSLVNRIFKALDEPIAFNDMHFDVNISVGICIYPDNAENRESLIKNADMSMYKAKKESGNSYCFY
jgi:diguanylate cyclase (GGDEF)-like protein/PAS domain S-box-containing protein